MTRENTPRRAAPPPRLSPSQHVTRHLRLAIPVMLSRAGLVIMFSVDSIMTGRAGASHLAHYAIALAPQMTLLILSVGLLIGTVVLTAQADGADRPGDCGPIWSTSLWIAAGLGCLSTHHHGEIPPVGGARVFDQVSYQLAADVSGRFKPECRDVSG